MDRVEAKSKGINCFTCTATANNPLKCSRPEYQGTYKKCEGEALAPANTCYKSVNTKTGGNIEYFLEQQLQDCSYAIIV